MSPDWTATTGSGDALVLGVLLVGDLLLAGPALRLLLACLSLVPGRVGLVALAAGKAVRPGLARRLVAVVVGLGVPAASVVVSAPAAHARAFGVVGQSRPAPAPLPAPAASRTLSAPHSPGSEPRAVRSAATSVVVVPGDTLWDIARRHLPAGATAGDVARAWPRWYAANRAVIGPDPSMLRPGTRLCSPDHRSAGTPRGRHHHPPTTPRGSAAVGALALSLDPDRR